jgi:2'-5' RNA ligase
MNSDDVVRAFVAVEIGEEARRTLAETVRLARRLGGLVRWVEPGAMHFTLAFLGNIFGASLGSLSSGLDAAASCAAFNAEIRGIGFFGRPESPRVIWAGVGRGADRLKAVHADLSAMLASMGFGGEEREWVPHLTIGRVKSARGFGKTAAFLGTCGDRVFGEFQVDRLVLMKSELRPDGPVYSRIHESPMGPAGR